MGLRRNLNLVTLLFLLIQLGVAAEQSFGMDFLVNQTSIIGKHFRGWHDKVIAQSAYESYLTAIPRDIVQLDVDGFTSAACDQASQRIASLNVELEAMQAGFTAPCTAPAIPVSQSSVTGSVGGVSVTNTTVLRRRGSSGFAAASMCAMADIQPLSDATVPRLNYLDFRTTAHASTSADLDADLTWSTYPNPMAPETLPDTAVLWRRVVDAHSSAVRLAPAPVATSNLGDQRLTSAFVEATATILPKAAAVVIDPFINNDYATTDLPRLYSNMFHLARTVLMSLGDSDGMTIHSTDGRYVGDNTYLPIADASHTSMIRGLHHSDWNTRLAMLGFIKEYMADVAVLGLSENGLRVGSTGIVTRDLGAAIMRAVEAITRSSSAQGDVGYVLPAEAPAYLYILTAVPEVDPMFGYDLRKLLLDCGVGIIPVFIDIRSTLPAPTKSTWETVKGYFSTTDSQWTRAMCDVRARIVTPGLMYDPQIDPFIDNAAKYTARTDALLAYTTPTRSSLLGPPTDDLEELSSVFIDIVRTSTAVGLALAPTPPSAPATMIIKDPLTGVFALELSRPVMASGQLQGVVTVSLDVESTLLAAYGPDNVNTVPGWPFDPEISLFSVDGGHGAKLIFHSRIDATRLTDEDRVEQIDVAELELWEDRAAFTAFMARVADGKVASVETLTNRLIGSSGPYYSTIRTRVEARPITDSVMMVTTWPEQSHRIIILRPELLEMPWCPDTFPGTMSDFLEAYTGRTCYDPMMPINTKMFVGDDAWSVAYRAQYNLTDSDNPRTTNYTSYSARFNQVDREHSVSAMCDPSPAALPDYMPFLDFNDFLTHAMPPRTLDWWFKPEGFGQMLSIAAMSAVYRLRVAEDPALMDLATFLYILTANGGGNNIPAYDWLSGSHYCTAEGGHADLTQTFFKVPFTAEGITFTDPYINDAGTVGVAMGVTAHLVDQGYNRPFGIINIAMDVGQVSAALGASSACGEVVPDAATGHSVYVDCFLMTPSMAIVWQNDPDQLFEDALLSDTGRVTLPERYPDLFAPLYAEGVFIRRNTIDYSTMESVEEFTIAPDFGKDEKIIVDGELIAARCVERDQLAPQLMAVQRVTNPGLKNRRVIACQIPGMTPTIVMTQNRTLGTEGFVAPPVNATELALHKSSLFEKNVETVSPGFGDVRSGTWSVDSIADVYGDWGIFKSGQCSVSKTSCPIDLAMVAIMALTTMLVLGTHCGIRMTAIVRGRRC